MLPTFSLLLMISIAVDCSSELREPRIFNLRDPEDPDALQELLWRYKGNSTSSTDTEHFGLLEPDGDGHVLVASVNAVHNLSLSTFRPVSIYRWSPSEGQRRDCLMKSMQEDLCRNFVRVLARLSPGRLLVCGTNALLPLCRILNPSWETVAEFPAVGLVPADPRLNSSSLISHGDIYSATVTDFAGEDPLLFRRKVIDSSSSPSLEDRGGLRTQRGNTLQLDRPQFIGTLQTEQYVYLFFREEAVEADFQPTSYSRVARVCKSDRGGPRHYGQEWTSFVKARLNCSIAGSHGGRPFFFNSLVAVSAHSPLAQHPADQLVYATFVSEFDFLRHSVVCAFRLADIDAIFQTGPYLAFDASQRRWSRRARDPQTAGLGQCWPPNSSQLLTEDEALARRKFPLMADSVPSALPSGAAGIYQGSDRYSQIAVLSNLRHDAGASDVLYVATDQGNLLKLVNLQQQHNNSSGNNNQNQSSGSSGNSAVGLLHLSTVQLSPLPIRRLLLLPAQNALLVITDQLLYRLPLHFCSGYASCVECLESRDPHCVWSDGECRAREQAELEAKKQKREIRLIQDVFARRGHHQVCEGQDDPKKAAEARATSKGQRPSNRGEKANDVMMRHSIDGRIPRPLETTATTNLFGSEKCKCAAVSEKAAAAHGHKCECPTATADFLLEAPMPKREGEDEQQPSGSRKWPGKVVWSGDLQTLPWWVLLLLVLALLQTVAFIWLCCIRHRRCRNNKTLMNGRATVSTSSNCTSMIGGGLISAYSPASLAAPVGSSSAAELLQSDRWTTLSTSSSTNPSSPTSTPKGPHSAEMAVPGGPTSFLQSWHNLWPGRRASVSGGEISVQLDGSAGPHDLVAGDGGSPFYGTLPPISYYREQQQQLYNQHRQQQQQQQYMSTFRRC